MWFSAEALAAWAAEPGTTRGGQPWSSALAILTALPLKAVFRWAFRQTGGLLGAVIGRLGLARRVPDHPTRRRRATPPERPRRRSIEAGGEAEPLPRLVDSTGLPRGGPGAWRVEKHGTRKRRAWRQLPLGVDAASGEIGAAELTAKAVEDGAPVGPLLDQLEAALASFPGDGADDREDGYGAVAARHPAAAVIVPPRAMAATAPTPRDQHLQPHGRLGWQKASGDHRRALAEAAISRSKRVIGDALRSPTDRGQVTEVAIAARALNRLLALGRPEPVRIA